MWAWGSDQHARFWPRRMLHETTVHRADAELAGGTDPSVDDAVGIDGVDELLDNLPSAVYFAPNVAELKGDGDTLAIVAGDGDGDSAGRSTSREDGFAWSHDDPDRSVGPRHRRPPAT